MRGFKRELRLLGGRNVGVCWMRLLTGRVFRCGRGYGEFGNRVCRGMVRKKKRLKRLLRKLLRIRRREKRIGRLDERSNNWLRKRKERNRSRKKTIRRTGYKFGIKGVRLLTTAT